jgi:hypothetical protein
VRYAYEEVINVLADKDQNNIPEILDQGWVNIRPVHSGEPRMVVNTRVKVNGQEVSMNNLSAELRQAMGKINPGQSMLINPVPPANPTNAWKQPSAPIVPPTVPPKKTTDPRLYMAMVVIALLLLIILGLLAFGFYQFAR